MVSSGKESSVKGYGMMKHKGDSILNKMSRKGFLSVLMSEETPELL